MILKAEKLSSHKPEIVVNLRCPACMQRGIFEPLGSAQDVLIANITPYVYAGQRRCPNPECKAHLFFAQQNKNLLVSYPSERIDFDATNIPKALVSSLEDAITCHANQCYVASAIMVRKTLEELCRDRSAKGSNLKERIKQLGTKVVLPKELLDGLDDLRLLGNDAAHIESKEYDKVGQEEVEVGIELSKEVLKAVYQYKSLLSRLRALKKSS